MCPHGNLVLQTHGKVPGIIASMIHLGAQEPNRSISKAKLITSPVNATASRLLRAINTLKVEDNWN